MNKNQLHALLYEALETEKGGVLVYEAALNCATNEDLIEEWENYPGQGRQHVVSPGDANDRLMADFVAALAKHRCMGARKPLRPDLLPLA